MLIIEEFINKKIILKKRKKTFTEDTSYYVEDIRKMLLINLVLIKFTNKD